MGFEATPQTDGGPNPGCLFIAGNEIETVTDSSKVLYLKREDGYAGHTFFFGKTSWGECTVSCGGGVQEATYHCMKKEGVSAKTGMCTYLTAMNPDALPEKEHACNEMECLEAESPIGDCMDHLGGCITGLRGTYYDYSGYYAVQNGWCTDHNTWAVCPSSLYRYAFCGSNRWMGGNYYYNADYYEETGNVFKSKPGTINGVETGFLDYDMGYYGMSETGYDKMALTFQCPNTAEQENTIKLNFVDNTHGDNQGTPIVYHECACDKKKKK